MEWGGGVGRVGGVRWCGGRDGGRVGVAKKKLQPSFVNIYCKCVRDKAESDASVLELDVPNIRELATEARAKAGLTKALYKALGVAQ